VLCCCWYLVWLAAVGCHHPLAVPLCLRAQKPGELMLIPSGWWHMAYNPVETLAFSSQFLNPQNYRPALYGVLSGNEAVGDCVVNHPAGIARKLPLDDGFRSWKDGQEYEWTRPELSFPYNGTMAEEETAIVLGCLRATIQPVQIPGKEELGKTSGLKWLPKEEADRKIAAGEFNRIAMDDDDVDNDVSSSPPPTIPTELSDGDTAAAAADTKPRRRRRKQATSEL